MLNAFILVRISHIRFQFLVVCHKALYLVLYYFSFILLPNCLHPSIGINILQMILNSIMPAATLMLPLSLWVYCIFMNGPWYGNYPSISAKLFGNLRLQSATTFFPDTHWMLYPLRILEFICLQICNSLYTSSFGLQSSSSIFYPLKRLPTF